FSRSRNKVPVVTLLVLEVVSRFRLLLRRERDEEIVGGGCHFLRDIVGARGRRGNEREERDGEQGEGGSLEVHGMRRGVDVKAARHRATGFAFTRTVPHRQARVCARDYREK